jgi:tRNA-specific 2-thiouridylase
MAPNAKTVAIAMSGGVDSSVAAALLKEDEYNVIGLTMHLWDYESVGGNVCHESSCCSVESIDDARAVCQSLGIPHYVIDVRDDFEKHVISNFVSEYMSGRTPNPCVLCNSMMKWTSLFARARLLGADMIATGHYAQIVHADAEGRYMMLKGIDDGKDQSYALWALTQEQLARTLFPVGRFSKKQIRQFADDLDLKTKDQEESQEICFIPDNDYGRFLRERVPAIHEQLKGGEIVNTNGDVLGHHDGYPFFTIGQRKGLGISVGKPLYVLDIDPDNNQIVVGDKADLETNGLIAGSVNWVSIEPPQEAVEAIVKIRYNDTGKAAGVIPQEDGTVRILFDHNHQAVTPGQSAVFYEDNRVLGGGIIMNRLLHE